MQAAALRQRPRPPQQRADAAEQAQRGLHLEQHATGLQAQSRAERAQRQRQALDAGRLARRVALHHLQRRHQRQRRSQAGARLHAKRSRAATGGEHAPLLDHHQRQRRRLKAR
jgi:hypothetical protein